jgi:hypothetical protein
VDGENVEQVNMFSTPLIAPPLTIGRWNSKELKMPLSIYGEFSCTLWADSTTGANNAYFEVSILRGSTVVAEYNTSRKDISAGAQPTRFDINDILNVELQGGETLGVMVGFDADPLSLISPAQATFYFGGGQYKSGITVKTLPIKIDIMEPDVEDNADFIGFKVLVKEAFDANPADMNFTIVITPPPGGQMKHLGQADSSKTDDGIMFSIDWDYTKEKKLKDGLYKVAMTATYDGNFTFSNSTSFNIDVPDVPITDLQPPELNPYVVGGAAVALVIVILAIYLNRRKIFRGKLKRKGKGKVSVKGKGKKRPPKSKTRSKSSKKRKRKEEEDD